MNTEDRKLIITMDQFTLDYLRKKGLYLVVAKVWTMLSLREVKPLVWICLNPEDLDLSTEIKWKELYQVYTSRDEIFPRGTISVAYSYPIDEKKRALRITDADGQGITFSLADFFGESLYLVEGYIDYFNDTDSKITCGIMQTCYDSTKKEYVSNQLCAFSLLPKESKSIESVNEVFLYFTSDVRKAGVVIKQCSSEEMMIKIRISSTTKIHFDHLKGWINVIDSPIDQSYQCSPPQSETVTLESIPQKSIYPKKLLIQIERSIILQYNLICAYSTTDFASNDVSVIGGDIHSFPTLRIGFPKSTITTIQTTNGKEGAIKAIVSYPPGVEAQLAAKDNVQITFTYDKDHKKIDFLVYRSEQIPYGFELNTPLKRKFRLTAGTFFVDGVARDPDEKCWKEMFDPNSYFPGFGFFTKEKIIKVCQDPTHQKTAKLSSGTKLIFTTNSFRNNTTAFMFRFQLEPCNPKAEQPEIFNVILIRSCYSHNVLETFKLLANSS